MVVREERQIQYFGLIKPTFDPNKKVKWWRLTADIIRPQISRYRNDRYPEYQTFYGYVQYLYEGRIYRTDTLQYNNAYIGYDYNTNGFLHAAISCQLEAVLTSFENQNNGLGLVNVARNNPIKSWEHLFLFPQEIKIRMLTPNNVMQFTFEHDYIDDCLVDTSPNPSPGTPPPPPPSRLEEPATTPDSSLPPNSPAYEGLDDNGQTYLPGNPNNLGEPPEEGAEPPVGNECTVYRVTADVYIPGPDPVTQFGFFYGPILDVFVKEDDAVVRCRGQFGFGSQDSNCQESFVDRNLSTNNVTRIENVVITKE